MSILLALDLETTGFSPTNDRILEIAVIAFDSETGIIDSEIQTLLNPERNISERVSKIHGLTAAELSMAPAFRDVGPWLAQMLSTGRVLAHNARFDVAFLNAEFSRNGIQFEILDFDCTYSQTGLDLKGACLAYDYELRAHHTALDDALAVRQIFISNPRSSIGTTTLSTAYEFEVKSPLPFTLNREQLGLPGTGIDAPRRVSYFRKVDIENVDPTELAYLWVLNTFLEDLILTADERFELDVLASDFGFSLEKQEELNKSYVANLKRAALRDGIVTPAEKSLLEKFASELGVELNLQEAEIPLSLPALGSLICATGTVTLDGISWDKKRVKEHAEALGYEYTDVLARKSGVILLLQDSEGSQSSKVEKALRWGISRMTISDFVRLSI